MTIFANKQQRFARSYLQGVIESATHPYHYRKTLHRLLQSGEVSSVLRPIYGNGFLPVNFKYLSMAFYDYANDYSHQPWQAATEALRPLVDSVAKTSLELDTNELNESLTQFKPATSSLVSQVDASSKMKQDIASDALTNQLSKARRDQSADDLTSITLPGYARTPQKPPSEHNINSPAMSPKQEGKRIQGLLHTFLENANGDVPTKRMQEKLAEQVIPQRLPKNFSLHELVKKLEEANFVHDSRNTEFAKNAAISKQSELKPTARVDARPTRIMRLLGEPLTGEASSSLAAFNMGSKAQPLHQQSIAQSQWTQKLDITPVASRRWRHSQEQEKMQQEVKAQRTRQEQQDLAVASPMPGPLQIKRVRWVDYQTTDAVWERSYMPHVELRMYR